MDPEPPLDYSLFGLWVLREAFEDAGKEQTPGDGAMRAACMWMLYAAGALWRNSKAGRQVEGNMGIGGGEYAERGWTGFAEERWGVWKEGFVAAEKTCDDERVRLLLRDAIRQMERVQTRS